MKPGKKSRRESGIAVIGTGYWGKNLVRNFEKLGVLKLICDSNETALQQIKKEHPRIETCLSLNDVLSRKDVQGIVVATPAETHFQIAREALLSGKHIFVEKPLVLDEREGEELIGIAKEKKLTLMVGHLLQYHPVFVKLKELATGGELGRINYIYSHRLNLGKIRREENILWSFAPHDISMILAIAGEDPESVLTTGGNYLHRKIADVTTTHLEFSSGLKAHIFVSWLHPFKDQKLVVVGDRKMAVFDDTQPWAEKLLLYPHEIKWKNNVPVPARKEPERVPKIKEAEPLRLECEHFLECIQGDHVPLTNGTEGLRVLRILNASQRSLDSRGTKIGLNGTGRNGNQPGKNGAAEPAFFVHPTAILDENVSIGAGTRIWHFSHVLSGSTVGDGCNIGQNVVIGPDVTIGNLCKVQNNISIYPRVTLEDGVFCGPAMVFTNVYNPRAEIKKMDEARPTLVKRGATIGANATIVCGHTIGRYAFIGAGTVVNRDIPDHALVVGNPARQIGWVCCCGEKLSKELECSKCGSKYNRNDNGIG